MGVSTSRNEQCRPRQSPITISTKKVKYDSSLKPLYIYYDPKSSRRLVNVGHCFNVEYDDTNDRSVLGQGPLIGYHRLRQFHFHWGFSDKDGSEHVIDGQEYPAELHIVHWNSQKYPSFNEAMKHTDGLAVIGVLLKIGEPNPAIQNIIDSLGQVKTKDKECPFTRFDLSSLLPNDRNYWTYQGSLTTSPYLECVTWIILQEAIPISSDQLHHFRGLLCSSENEDPSFILENHRALQPLAARIIRSSCKNKTHKP
ncbi:carbonic anhydrase 13-like isoform X1 [Bufo bufo]|uniref:carbonic anhydrase 13-like isoform X1 n=1 Tax=Bufo bufo TaxID=8384 RepID=UPI001ABE78E8|nr:carbonic anhydrase 13-like isoform X1 [Bufo bufo]XP_040288215.1 carbonic anhydrase 13-like isoform X1 [Bufo bufo]XP_040288216.1 carbonic anhydrase 13-like isoform X1 [Bufo bufo]XP_040288218.1 carbonic anhydrase 13-like isoform X1 [Bufo bufo]